MSGSSVEGGVSPLDDFARIEAVLRDGPKTEPQRHAMQELMDLSSKLYVDYMDKQDAGVRNKRTQWKNPLLWKTTICDYFAQGKPCRFGAKCWYAHGERELRYVPRIDECPTLYAIKTALFVNPEATGKVKELVLKCGLGPLENILQLAADRYKAGEMNKFPILPPPGSVDWSHMAIRPMDLMRAAAPPPPLVPASRSDNRPTSRDSGHNSRSPSPAHDETIHDRYQPSRGSHGSSSGRGSVAPKMSYETMYRNGDDRRDYARRDRFMDYRNPRAHYDDYPRDSRVPQRYAQSEAGRHTRYEVAYPSRPAPTRAYPDPSCVLDDEEIGMVGYGPKYSNNPVYREQYPMGVPRLNRDYHGEYYAQRQRQMQRLQYLDISDRDDPDRTWQGDFSRSFNQYEEERRQPPQQQQQQQQAPMMVSLPMPSPCIPPMMMGPPMHAPPMQASPMHAPPMQGPPSGYGGEDGKMQAMFVPYPLPSPMMSPMGFGYYGPPMGVQAPAYSPAFSTGVPYPFHSPAYPMQSPAYALAPGAPPH